MFAQFADGREAVVGDLLFADLQELGDIAVGPTFDEEQLEYLDSEKLATLLPLPNHRAQRAGKGQGFELASFLAASDARCAEVAGVFAVAQNFVGGITAGLGGPTAGAAEIVGDFVGGDAEQVRLQAAMLVEVGQAVEKADERLLDDVLGRGAVVQLAFGKGEQSPFVKGDQLLPGPLVAAADGSDE